MMVEACGHLSEDFSSPRLNMRDTGSDAGHERSTWSDSPSQADSPDNQPFLCRWQGCDERFSSDGDILEHLKRHVGSGKHTYVCKVRSHSLINMSSLMLPVGRLSEKRKGVQSSM